MNWEDEGFIIAKRKFRENAIILDVFTNKFGRVSGIVYGGTSRKIKNHLQLANKIFVIYNTKSENRIGYFKTELIKPISPKFFNDKKIMLCLNSISSLLKILLPENQAYKEIYNSLNFFFTKLDDENWKIDYLNWELNLINNLGFGFNFNSNKFANNNSKSIYKLKIDNIDYNIPNFLLTKKNENVNSQDLYNGLNFCRNLMQNKFFLPNNIKFPYSRRLLENEFF